MSIAVNEFGVVRGRGDFVISIDSAKSIGFRSSSGWLKKLPTAGTPSWKTASDEPGRLSPVPRT